MNKQSTLPWLMAGVLVAPISGQVLAKNAHKPAQLVQFEFAMEANHATMKHTTGNHYDLLIPKAEVRSVLAFSDRPNRIAISMKPSDFWQEVSKGPSSFEENPPQSSCNVGQKIPSSSIHAQ